jgi:hypothetical protein
MLKTIGQLLLVVFLLVAPMLLCGYVVEFAGWLLK